METVGDDLIDQLTISGTPEQCAARLHDYDGLVDEILCLNVGAGLGRHLDEHSEQLLFEIFSLARNTAPESALTLGEPVRPLTGIDERVRTAGPVASVIDEHA